MTFAPLSDEDMARFTKEFARWFWIDADRASGTVRLTLAHNEMVTKECVRLPGETLEQFIDKFLPFAWRTLWNET